MIDTLLAARTKGGQEGLAFYYCDRNDPLNSTPEAVLRAILKQLSSLDTGTGLLNPVVNAYKKAEDAGLTSETLDLGECRDLIIEILQSYSQINIIIDALDECQKETRSRLIVALKAIMESAPDVNLVKIFISSRDDDDILLKLNKHPNIRIDPQDNSQDISTFVESEIDRRINEQELLRGTVSDDLRDYVKSTLIKQADGM